MDDEPIELAQLKERYYDPEPDPNNSAVLIIPADATPDRVSVQDQAKVRNLGG